MERHSFEIQRKDGKPIKILMDKKEIKSNFKNAREYEIEQMLEKIVEDYIFYINKQY